MLGREPAGACTGGSRGDGARKPVDLIDWDELFAGFCHALGWAWSTCEAELDLHRLQAFNRHWREHPPTHALVAAYLEYDADKAEAAHDAKLLQLMTSLPVDENAPKLDASAWAAHVAAHPQPETTDHG